MEHIFVKKPSSPNTLTLRLSKGLVTFGESLKKFAKNLFGLIKYLRLTTKSFTSFDRLRMRRVYDELCRMDGHVDFPGPNCSGAKLGGTVARRRKPSEKIRALHLLFVMGAIIIPLRASHTFPFISGDNFRAIANHIFDERKTEFNPLKVKERDIVFVKTFYLKKFFMLYHHRIRHPYILLTHNDDEAIPGNYLAYLNDPKIIAWFGINATMQHPKLHPVPIGICNERYQPQGASIIAAMQKIAPTMEQRDFNNKLLYMNITISTNNAVRKKVYDIFWNQPFCYNAPKKTFAKYAQEMAQFCFVVSPEGNGLDCYRTWEALYLGCIPVVKSNSLNALYENLPVVIVDDWSDVTEQFLYNQFEIMKNKQYDLEKLSIYYWFGRINEYKYLKKIG